jgi:hypothetical protein
VNGPASRRGYSATAHGYEGTNWPSSLRSAAGLVIAAVALVRTRQLLLPLAVLLDFLTAASLLRLAGPPTWPLLGAATLTIAIRQLASRSLRAARGLGPLGLDHGRVRGSTIKAALRRR